MDINRILAAVDHTLLAQDAVWEQVKTLCDDGLRCHIASVCIPPSFVRQAKDYVGDRLAVCTVIGFPNGYSTTAVKCFETEDAVQNGADEIDMVINLGWVKEQNWDALLAEIRAVKAACRGKLLKVIVEACLLTREEKINMSRVVSMSGADFLKTSTGFSTGGATLTDVSLFHQHLAPGVRLKAAGGIKTLEQAQSFLDAGADRIGASGLLAELP